MCYTSKAIGPKAHNKKQYTLTVWCNIFVCSLNKFRNGFSFLQTQTSYLIISFKILDSVLIFEVRINMLYLADVHGGKTEWALPSIIAILKVWDRHEFSFAREGHTLRRSWERRGWSQGSPLWRWWWPVSGVWRWRTWIQREGEIGWNKASVADLFVGLVSPMHWRIDPVHLSPLHVESQASFSKALAQSEPSSINGPIWKIIGSKPLP